MNLYEQIQQNKRNSILLIVAVLAAVIGAVAAYSYAVRGDFVLPVIAAMIAIPSSFIGYYQGDKIALLTNGAQPLADEEAPDVHNIIENLAITAGIPKPKVYIIDSPAMNAFATGRDPEHASMAVTTGLLSHLTRAELEGVIAHELSHVKNYDIRFGTLVAIFVGFIVILSDLFTRTTLWGGMGGRRNNNDREGGNQIQALLFIVGLVFLILSPIFAKLVQLAISRQREYLADSSGVLLTRYPEGLASALEKISQSTPLKTASASTAPLYIANPFNPHALANLFSTHPPIAERIKRLREIA